MTTPERHPFRPFAPKNARYLLLGSFPGRESTQQVREGDWFYGALRNQFWTILQGVYQRRLTTLYEKQALFADLGIAITDIVAVAERTAASNLDKHLRILEYNTAAIELILSRYDIQTIFFTSQGVRKDFEQHIEPHLTKRAAEKVVLPSPSPIYQALTVEEKIERYRALLPRL